MNDVDLFQLYFDRSQAIQWYWTLYVVIVGGLLAFSSLRQRRDLITTILVSILFVCFAHKNGGAIVETMTERDSILAAIKVGPGAAESADARRLRDAVLPTLNPPGTDGVRAFHITSDVLTLLAVWAMELRRRRSSKAESSVQPFPA